DRSVRGIAPPLLHAHVRKRHPPRKTYGFYSKRQEQSRTLNGTFRVAWFRAFVARARRPNACTHTFARSPRDTSHSVSPRRGSPPGRRHSRGAYPSTSIQISPGNDTKRQLSGVGVPCDVPYQTIIAT